MFRIVFFQTRAEGEPVRTWLRNLEREEKLTIGADLLKVQRSFPLGMPLCRPLGEGLFELRSSLPSNRIARVLFFQREQTLILIGGFIKKTQKTPDQEIALARRRKKEHERNSRR